MEWVLAFALGIGLLVIGFFVGFWVAYGLFVQAMLHTITHKPDEIRRLLEPDNE